MNYWSLLTALLFALSLRSLAGAEKDENSPLYMYMERLRNVTRNMGGVETNLENAETTSKGSSQTPGTLLATSFKDTCKFCI